MSITDELRAWGRATMMPSLLVRMEAIADRIDVEYQKAIRELNGLAEDSVLLPKDADGEPIRVGDKVTCARSVWQVTGLRLTGLAWGVCCTIFNDHGGSGTNVYPPCDLRHHHAPTVEDVLREFANEVYADADNEIRDRDFLCAKYAKRLTLAGGEDA